MNVCSTHQTPEASVVVAVRSSVEIESESQWQVVDVELGCRPDLGNIDEDCRHQRVELGVSERRIEHLGKKVDIAVSSC